jgi:hypothetical protein
MVRRLTLDAHQKKVKTPKEFYLLMRSKLDAVKGNKSASKALRAFLRF